MTQTLEEYVARGGRACDWLQVEESSGTSDAAGQTLEHQLLKNYLRCEF